MCHARTSLARSLVKRLVYTGPRLPSFVIHPPYSIVSALLTACLRVCLKRTYADTSADCNFSDHDIDSLMTDCADVKMSNHGEMSSCFAYQFSRAQAFTVRPQAALPRQVGGCGFHAIICDMSEGLMI